MTPFYEILYLPIHLLATRFFCKEQADYPWSRIRKIMFILILLINQICIVFSQMLWVNYTVNIHSIGHIQEYLEEMREKIDTESPVDVICTNMTAKYERDFRISEWNFIKIKMYISTALIIFFIFIYFIFMILCSVPKGEIYEDLSKEYENDFLKFQWKDLTIKEYFPAILLIISDSFFWMLIHLNFKKRIGHKVFWALSLCVIPITIASSIHLGNCCIDKADFYFNRFLFPEFNREVCEFITSIDDREKLKKIFDGIKFDFFTDGDLFKSGFTQEKIYCPLLQMFHEK